MHTNTISIAHTHKNTIESNRSRTGVGSAPGGGGDPDASRIDTYHDRPTHTVTRSLYLSIKRTCCDNRRGVAIQPKRHKFNTHYTYQQSVSK